MGCSRMEQRISNEKFSELQQKIKEYSEMYNAEETMLQKCSKLPPIAENDNLEKEVNDLQEEFSLYKKQMEMESQRKQMEIEQLMQTINLYKANDNDLEHYEQEIKPSHESTESDETYVLEKLFLNPQKTSQASEDEVKTENVECAYIRQQKKKTNSLMQRLQYQGMKNFQLQNILSQQQRKMNKTVQGNLDQHGKELARDCLALSQKMWLSLKETTKKQAEQIALSDVLVKELYCENSRLNATIHQLEQQSSDFPSLL